MTPFPSDVFATQVKLRRKDRTLPCVMDARRVDGVVTETSFRGFKANIRAIEMKVAKPFVKANAGGTPENEDDFVKGLDPGRSIKGRTVHPLG